MRGAVAIFKEAISRENAYLCAKRSVEEKTEEEKWREHEVIDIIKVSRELSSNQNSIRADFSPFRED